jgi:hypothetical protein
VSRAAWSIATLPLLRLPMAESAVHHPTPAPIPPRGRGEVSAAASFITYFIARSQIFPVKGRPRFSLTSQRDSVDPTPDFFFPPQKREDANIQ